MGGHKPSWSRESISVARAVFPAGEVSKNLCFAVPLFAKGQNKY